MTRHINLSHQPLPAIASDEEALQLGERYFDALTSEVEEEALKHYVAFNTRSDDKRFDELRAVMGLAAASRRQQTTTKIKPKFRVRRTTSQHNIRRWSIAAAVTAIILSGATITYSHRQSEDCFAYIDGERTTDTELVMEAMRSSTEKMQISTGNDIAETQLNDMFNTLETPHAQ